MCLPSSSCFLDLKVVSFDLKVVSFDLKVVSFGSSTDSSIGEDGFDSDALSCVATVGASIWAYLLTSGDSFGFKAVRGGFFSSYYIDTPVHSLLVHAI